MRAVLRFALGTAVLGLVSPGAAAAQPIGTFAWQTQPVLQSDCGGRDASWRHLHLGRLRRPVRRCQSAGPAHRRCRGQPRWQHRIRVEHRDRGRSSVHITARITLPALGVLEGRRRELWNVCVQRRHRWLATTTPGRWPNDCLGTGEPDSSLRPCPQLLGSDPSVDRGLLSDTRASSRPDAERCLSTGLRRVGGEQRIRLVRVRG